MLENPIHKTEVVLSILVFKLYSLYAVEALLPKKPFLHFAYRFNTHTGKQHTPSLHIYIYLQDFKIWFDLGVRNCGTVFGDIVSIGKKNKLPTHQ